MRISRLGGLLLGVVLGASALSGGAHAATTCQLGGLPSSFQVVRIDLPNGSEYLGLGIGGRKSTLLLHDNESDWYLAHGIIIVNAQTRAIGAYWIHTVSAVGGGAPPRAVLEIDGQTILNERVPVADGTQGVHARAVPAGLPPGSWYAIGFGIGGGRDTLGPTEWRATLISPGIHSCEPLPVEGETFGYNHTHFSGGTQAYASGVGVAQDVKLELRVDRQMAVGILGATVLAPHPLKRATLSYWLPNQNGRIDDDIAPFASTVGDYRFQADYQGLSPTILISGVTFDP